MSQTRRRRQARQRRLARAHQRARGIGLLAEAALESVRAVMLPLGEERTRAEILSAMLASNGMCDLRDARVPGARRP